MNPHFASLVLGLAHQANAALTGQLPAEIEGQPVDALQIAHSLIDTLGMLEEKTAGHLEEDEQQLLAETLTALRFEFVKASGSSEAGTTDDSS